MLKWSSLFIATLFLTLRANAQQLPMGMYEGLLGNSGVALTDSTAPSRYNPSLLRHRSDNSYSIGGNAFGSMSSRNSGSEFNSLNLSPTYLSSIINGDALVHEIFFNTIRSGPVQLEIKKDNQITKTEIDVVSARFGYSMAFKSIPFGMQFLGRYSQRRDFSFFQATDPVNSTTIIAQSESEKKFLGASVGLSGHCSLGGYTLGFNFLSRGLDLYKNGRGKTKTFTKTATNFTSDETESDSESFSEAGNNLSIGHEFKVGYHQFITDTILAEDRGLNNAYSANQSFGYKLSSKSGHQFLVGFQHEIGPEIQYFGQSMYTSVGYSWLKRSLRSAIGTYFYNSKTADQTTLAFGMTYSSEFQY